MRHQWRAVVTAALTLALAAGASWQPADPHTIDLENVLAGPSMRYWLGTDHLGRDLLSRVMAGAAPSLIAIIIALSSIVGLGVLAGAVIALGGPAARHLVRRAAETVLAAPTLIIAIVLSSFVGGGPAAAALALAATAWAPYAIVTAALMERLTAEPYWKAAVALGATRLQAVVHHLLPQLAGPLGALAGADAGRAVLVVATLGFLGLAADTGRPEWGTMIHEYRMFVFDTPRLLLVPIAAIAGLALSFHLVLDCGGRWRAWRRTS